MYSLNEMASIANISVEQFKELLLLGIIRPEKEDPEKGSIFSEQQINDVIWIVEMEQLGFSMKEIELLLNTSISPIITYKQKLLELRDEHQKILAKIKRLENKIYDFENATHTVLVVEDAAFMRMLISDTLVHEMSFCVTEASDGKEAVEKYQASKPDLVIMNLTMPKLDGIDATRAIIENDKKAKIIMLSAKCEPEMVLQSVLAGAQDFIVKPFEADYLVKTVQRNIAERYIYNYTTAKTILEDDIGTRLYSERKTLTQPDIARLLKICQNSYASANIDFLL